MLYLQRFLGYSSAEVMSFSGEPGEDVTVFFRDFFRSAMSAGYHRDDAWMKDRLEAALSGPGLQHIVSLDDATRANFESARYALMRRFTSHNDAPDAPPAAAAPPPRGRSSRSDSRERGQDTSSEEP